MNKNYYNRILMWSKKVKAFEILGNKCKNCGDTNIFHLVFHHRDVKEKEFDISDKKSYRWSIIEKEIKKCDLLCQNCHRELHKNDNNTIFNDNKKLFLEFKNITKCQKCNYDKYNGSLHFHHKNDKKFNLSSIIFKCESIFTLSEKIVKELNKCEILCSNCHQEYHTDVEFFELYKDIIYEKSKKLKDKMSKINRDIVRKMYFDDGKRQIDIVKYFGCKKSTISDIIKELKQK